MSAPLKHKTDAAQRGASDPFSSVWVAANAGSGKTHALTNRVARLLLSGTPPERILCLTFTRAAAAEMSSRLFQRLGEWATQEEEDLRIQLEDLEGAPPSEELIARARRLFARAIETPGGLKIQTIHAFCERILGRFPLEADIEPHFEVMDDRTGAELKREARERLMRDAGQNPEQDFAKALAFMVNLKDEKGFIELTEDLFARRGMLDELFTRHGGLAGTVAATREHLGLQTDETAENIQQAMRDGIPEAELRAAADVLAEGTKTDKEQFAKLIAYFRAPLAERQQQFPLYWRAFFTAKDAPLSRLITKKLGETYPATAEALLEEQNRLEGLRQRLLTARLAEKTNALLAIAERLIQSYASEKQRRSQLDYDDLIRRTRDLLMRSRMAAWVLYKLDGGLDHILVDEAQDTSPEQWDIIRLITEEFLAGEGASETRRTLFAVGDEKQSIYSFQGAEPERFGAMRHYFERRVRQAELQWQQVRLVRSFRSTPEVLKTVDAVFETWDARDGLSAEGEVDTHIPVRELDPGLVELWDLERPDPETDPEPWDLPLDYLGTRSAVSKLAQRIADKVAGWLAAGEWSVSRKRPIRPGDIAILVRRRTAFATEVVRSLKARDVPVAGMDRMHLTDELAVMDLIALGRFCLLPEDDLTLATVLKGPFVGLAEEDLFALAYNRTGSLWKALQERAASEPDTPWQRMAHWLKESRLMARRARPFEFYADLLGARGGRRQLLARLGTEALDPIEEFLSLALSFEQTHVPSLETFLHWVEGGGAEIKRDLDQGRDEVRLITVHGAKGLEADIVFMGETCGEAASGRHDPALLSSPDRDFKTANEIERAPSFLLFPVKKDGDDATSAAAREAFRLSQAQEYRRLLYVALTRARDRLYVTGHIENEEKDAPEDSWYALVRRAFEASTAVKGEFADGLAYWRIGEKIPAPATAPGQRHLGQTEASEAPARLPAWAFQPPPKEPEPPRILSPSRLLLDPNKAPPAASPLGVAGTGPADGRYKRGQLIHRLLQSLPDISPDARGKRATAFLTMPGHGLPPEAQDDIFNAVFKVFDDPAFAPIFVPEARAEVALSGSVFRNGHSHAISARIDRLLITSTEILVVDYKTNRPPPSEVENVAESYLLQMAAYRALLGEIYPGREIRTALLWTETPYLMPLPNELLDRLWNTRLV